MVTTVYSYDGDGTNNDDHDDGVIDAKIDVVVDCVVDGDTSSSCNKVGYD